ncbi:glutathione peroxidase [Neisseriaceae bacterium TC5R-5]|nr:glutathione peroxidase [Neisseriaceae bacterium TC5R-5]
MTTLYDFSAVDISGEPRAFADYRDQLVLIVNTASECGYTRQYSGLQELQDTFAEQGLVVLGFPCNQFGGQEPGSSEQIQQFCQSRFGVTFPLFSKVEVNGAQAHPLWRWLTQAGERLEQPVKWNFTKFLLNGKGCVVQRYEPAVEPHDLYQDIQALLFRADAQK